MLYLFIMFRSGTTTLIISNEEMNDISKTIKNEAKEQKGGFLSFLLGIIVANLLGNLLTGKGVKRSKIPGQGVMGAGEDTIRTSQIFNGTSSFN